MQEEYGEELGLFGRVDAPRLDENIQLDSGKGELAVIGKKKVKSAPLDSYLSNKMKKILDDEKIIEQIDEEIKQAQQENYTQKS